MPFSMDRIRPFLALGGLLLLVAAAMLYLIYQDFDLVVRIAGAAGIILLGIYVAIDPEDVFRTITGRRALYGGNTAVMVVAIVGILVVINVLATRFSQRWDLTASGQFTLSEQTLQVLDNLQQPVSITGFFQSGDPGKDRAEDLLKEYKLHANGKLQHEFVDPEIEVGKARSMGVREFGTLVFQQGDKSQSTTSVSEQDFTTALLKLTRTEQTKIYFTQGHGERSLDANDRDAYSLLKAQLGRDNYDVRTTTLLTERQVPADAAALIIAGPTKDFSPEEKQMLKDYLAVGGKLMLLQDPRVDVNLSDVFSQWKVSVGKEPVIDPGSSLPNDPRALVLQQYPPHPITDKMRVVSLLPLAAAVNRPTEPIQGVTITPLAQSSPSSWAETDPQTVRFDEGVDPRGPFTLAVAIEAGATTAGQAQPGATTTTAKRVRVVIFGDADFGSNDLVGAPVGNLDLFINSVDWLAEAENLISIRPKQQDTRQMFLTGTQLNLLMVTSTLVLPLVVLLAGAAVWWTRR